VVETQVTVTNPLGIHARPSAHIVQTAGKFKSEVRLIRGKLEVNGKSIMGVMMLAAEMGAKIIIRIWGDDEEECLAAVEEAFKIRFDDRS
jgi:phosphocarrier protein